jgi:hypothetical protein
LTKKNPLLKVLKLIFILPINNEIVGRISAIVNWGEVNDQQKRSRFGWFDVIDDIEVTKALRKVYELGRKMVSNVEAQWGSLI